MRGAQHTLNDQVGSQDGSGTHADTSLSGSIGSTHTGENDGGSTS